MKDDQEQMLGDRVSLIEKCSQLEEEKSSAIEDKEYLVGILSDATLVLGQALEVETDVVFILSNKNIYSFFQNFKMGKQETKMWMCTLP